MFDSVKMINDLKRDEGFRSKPYYCPAGKLTIGFGRNLDAVGISEAEAGSLLANDAFYAMRELRKKYEWFENLAPARQAAMVNMAFNLGMRGFAGFKKMIAAMSRAHYDHAAMECLDSLAAKKLKSRYERIAQMIKTGEYV